MKKTGIVFLVIAAIGFTDAAYLTVEHYIGRTPPCALKGCEVVLTSAQSTVAGIPVSLLGAFYYLTILILVIAFLDTKKEALLRKASYLTVIGFLVSSYLVYLQFFVIHNICQYCMLSAGTSTLLFITGMYTLRRIKNSIG